MRKQWFVTRVRILVAVCMLVAFALIGRLYMLQVMQGDLYLARAEAQTIQQTSPLLLRDSIYFSDKHGNLVLAATVAASASSTNRRYYPGAGQVGRVGRSLRQAVEQRHFASRCTEPQ